MRISKSYSFDAAHYLFNPEWSHEDNVSTFGKCATLHGHTYTLEVEVEGVVDFRTGMVLNYFHIDDVVKPIIETLDHKLLNDVFPTLITTAENMVQDLANTIATELKKHYAGRHVSLTSVTLSETPKTRATWRAR